jgi:putative flippase GtrA
MNKFIKFSLAGIINTLVDWSAYFLFNHFILENNNESLSKIIGISFGVFSAFILNILWVFKVEFDNLIMLSPKKFNFLMGLFFQFVLTYSIGMLINYISFVGLRELQTPEMYSLIISTLFSFSFNFLFVKNFILTAKQ